MATHTITRQVPCPMHAQSGACGETVELTWDGGPAGYIAACQNLLAQGWTGPQIVAWASDPDRYIPAEPTRIVRHRDGLVSFAIPA